MLCYVPGIIACAILHVVPISPGTRGVHLFAIFIIPMVATAAGLMYSLLASNVAGYTKKTVSGALFFTAYCVANIVSPQTFLQSEAPIYTTGIAVTLTTFCLNICLFAVLYVVYGRINAARDKLAAGAAAQDDTEDLVDAFSDLTDQENKKVRYKR